MGVSALCVTGQTSDATLLLLAVARQRDQRAFTRLFRHFVPRLEAYLRRTGCEPAEAEDLAQDVMFLVWRKAESFDPVLAGAGTWIFTIARNLHTDHRRREKQSRANLFPDETVPALAADTLLSNHQRDQCIHDALGQLPPQLAEIVRLSFFTDTPHPQIALCLGIPLGTVKSRMRSALRKVRTSLGEG